MKISTSLFLLLLLNSCNLESNVNVEIDPNLDANNSNHIRNKSASDGSLSKSQFIKTIETANSLLAGNLKTNDSQIMANLSQKMFDLGDKKLTNLADDFSENEIFLNKPLTKPDGSINDVNLRDTFVDLVDISIMVSLPETNFFSNPQYKNPETIDRITKALNQLLTTYYYNGSSHSGNWWNWEIGINKSLMEIITLLYVQLPKDIIAKALDVSSYMSPDPMYIFNSFGTEPQRVREISLGANRVDLIWIAMLRSAMNKDSYEYQAAVKGLYDLFVLVKTGDGVYEDGSIIQHVDIPYIAGYGSVLLKGYADIFYVLSLTGVTLEKKYIDFIYQSIFESYSPVLFKSQLLENFRGRGASRGWIRARTEAEGMIQSLLILYKVAPEEYKAKLGALIKHHLLSPDANRASYFIEEYANRLLPLSIAEKDILNNSDVTEAEGLVGNYLLYNSDRVIHRTPNWLFSISAFSDRVGNYECINGENLLGYNTSNGMTYLYDQDQEQYVNYWPMLDPILPAGTTNSMLDQPAPCSQILSGNTIDKTLRWVGGASTRSSDNTILSYGSFGMEFTSYNSEIYVKKSWFLFDKEIVAIGTDIPSSALSSDLLTAVDFRKIKSSGGNKIVIDGVNQKVGKTSLEKTGNFGWLFIEGDKVESSRGYIFEANQDITVSRHIEQRRSWADVNDFNAVRMSNPNVTYNTITLNISHASNDYYSYIILPSTNISSVEGYVASPSIEIIEKSDLAHIAKNKNLNIIAANIWSDSGYSSDNFSVTHSASLIYQIKQNKAYVWISNPKQESKTLYLTLNTLAAKSDIYTDTPELISKTSQNQFEIIFQQDYGGTLHFSFDL